MPLNILACASFSVTAIKHISGLSLLILQNRRRIQSAFVNIPLYQHYQWSLTEILLQSDPPIGQMTYAEQSTTSPQMSHSQNMPEVSTDAGYYSTSPSQQLVFPSPSPGLQNTSPNTPTSLPEIILTGKSRHLTYLSILL